MPRHRDLACGIDLSMMGAGSHSYGRQQLKLWAWRLSSMQTSHGLSSSRPWPKLKQSSCLAVVLAKRQVTSVSEDTLLL